jgi:hypothetical protein
MEKNQSAMKARMIKGMIFWTVVSAIIAVSILPLFANA